MPVCIMHGMYSSWLCVKFFIAHTLVSTQLNLTTTFANKVYRYQFKSYVRVLSNNKVQNNYSLIKLKIGLFEYTIGTQFCLLELFNIFILDFFFL